MCLLHFEEFHILLHERVLRLGEYFNEGILIQCRKRGNDRQPPHYLGNHPVLDDIFGYGLLEDVAEIGLCVLSIVLFAAESDHLFAKPLLDNVFQPDEGPPAYEHDL